MARIEISQGDAFNTDLPSDSVDVIVTSPPYFAFREYTDGDEKIYAVGNEEHPWEYIKALVDWGGECRRVLKDSGSLFVVLGDKYAGSGGHNNAGIGASKSRGPGRYSQSAYIDWTQKPIPNKSQMGLPTRYANRMTELGWVLRQTIIWSKPNSIPTNAKDRGEFTHEYVFHFVQGRDYHYNFYLRDHPEIYKSSVWEITSSEGLRYPKDLFERLETDRHYAAYPAELVRRILVGWGPEDGLVLDPFGGSGTTALVSKILGMRAVSLDLSAGYTRLARWRVFLSDHESKLKERWDL